LYVRDLRITLFELEKPELSISEVMLWLDRILAGPVTRSKGVDMLALRDQLRRSSSKLQQIRQDFARLNFKILICYSFSRSSFRTSALHARYSDFCTVVDEAMSETGYWPHCSWTADFCSGVSPDSNFDVVHPFKKISDVIAKT
jgi:hypothetical protein